jgi:molybdopterin-containing oxidoreductase family membrane subunit
MKTKSLSVTNIVLLGVLVALIIAGIATWVYQMIQGLQITGLSNPISWGLYIISFAFLVGLSAGGLIVTSLAYILNNKRLEAIAPLGIIVSVACVIGAMLIIIPDVGLPFRIPRILIRPNITSPLTWDIFILITYLVIGLVEAWVFFSKKWKAQPEKQERTLRVMAYIVLPVAVLVHSVTAWIFGFQVGRPFWFTGLMAPIFIASALVSGLALLVLVMLGVQKAGWMKIDDSQYPFLGGILAGFIAVDIFLFLSELLTIGYAGGIDADRVARDLISGSHAPFFWVEIFGGVVLPFLLLVLPATRRSKAWVGVASALAMIGVFLKRVNIILPPFEKVNIDYTPGVSLGRYSEYVSPFTTSPIYEPTLPEVVITIGVFAGVIFLIIVGVQYVSSLNKKSAPGEA